MRSGQGGGEAPGEGGESKRVGVPPHNLRIARVADEANIPVLCYGLRTDFRGELFLGSATLLGIADSLIELKAVCHCGRKATMNVRLDEQGNRVTQGEQVEIGGNDRYEAVCPRRFYTGQC